MKDEEIDVILSAEDPVQPSSGLVRSVMDRVRFEATTPPPIPFPWARAVPGLVAGCAAVTAIATAVVRGSGVGAQTPLAWIEAEQVIASVGGSPEVVWILAASLLVLATIRASWRLASR